MKAVYYTTGIFRVHSIIVATVLLCGEGVN